MLIGKNCLDPPRLILIVQHDNRNNTKRLLACVAHRHFALQILQEAIRKMIQSALAPGVLLVPRAAVGTNEFNLVLLRIAVQSSPPRAAHTDSFRVSPVHGRTLLGSTS